MTEHTTVTRRHAVVCVGMAPDAFDLEVFQPVCPDHEPPWHGPLTFDLATAKTNARVHNTDRHYAGAAR